MTATSTHVHSLAVLAARLRPIRLSLAIWLLACLPALAWAQVNCSATPAVGSVIDFGNYSPVSSPTLTVSTTLNVSCNGLAFATSVRACISIGTGSGGTTFAPRQMSSGASTLAYNILTSAGDVWGTRGNGSYPLVQVDVPVLAGNGSLAVPIRFTVPASQTTTAVGFYQSTFPGVQTELTFQPSLFGSVPPCSAITSPVVQFPLLVTATVIADCLISTSDVDFGTSGVLTTARTATGAITARCTNGASFTIALNAGTGAGATVANRRMTRGGGTQQVQYRLFLDSGRTQPWGDGTAGTTRASSTGTGAAQSFTIYGLVPAQPTPLAGAYADTVTATITY